MQRTIDFARQLLIGGDSEEDVAGLHCDLVVAEAVVLQDADVIERAFDQSLGAGLAIFLELVLLEAARVDANADRAAVGPRGGDDFAHPLL